MAYTISYGCVYCTLTYHDASSGNTQSVVMAAQTLIRAQMMAGRQYGYFSKNASMYEQHTYCK